jgi:hypothetical protein
MTGQKNMLFSASTSNFKHLQMTTFVVGFSFLTICQIGRSDFLNIDISVIKVIILDPILLLCYINYFYSQCLSVEVATYYFMS